MKFLLVGDVHAADKAPATRIDDYCQAIFDKLHYIIDYGNSNSINTMVIAGDLFHRKIPSHNSHYLVKSLIDIFSSFKGDIYAVAGNHDISANLDSLYKQPFSVLLEAKVLKLLTATPVILEDSNIKISLGGKSFETALDKKDAGLLYNLDLLEPVDFRIGVFHQMILPDGQSFFNDFINFEDLTQVNSDLIFDGHYHVGFDPALITYQRPSGTPLYFCNPGSISRGSADQFNLEKKPKVIVLDVSKEESVKVRWDEIYLPHKPANEVFDLVSVAKKKDKKAIYDFVNSLSDFEVSALESSDPEAFINLLQVMGCPLNIIPKARTYLEEAYEKINR